MSGAPLSPNRQLAALATSTPNVREPPGPIFQCISKTVRPSPITIPGPHNSPSSRTPLHLISHSHDTKIAKVTITLLRPVCYSSPQWWRKSSALFIEPMWRRESLSDPIIREPDIDLLPMEPCFSHKQFFLRSRRIWIRLMEIKPFQQYLALAIGQHSSLEMPALACVYGNRFRRSSRSRIIPELWNRAV